FVPFSMAKRCLANWGRFNSRCHVISDDCCRVQPNAVAAVGDSFCVGNPFYYPFGTLDISFQSPQQSFSSLEAISFRNFILCVMPWSDISTISALLD
ncbi:MAG: hypothetical protein ACKVLK_12735, partial [Spongiibacter sp.]